MTGAALPYSFDFNYDDGSPWLVGQWVSPGPTYSGTDPSDIRGGRGRITVGDPNDIGQFNARLWTDDSQDIDVSFQFDISEVIPALDAGAAAGDSDPRFYLWVQLEDDAVGTDRYEIYYSPYDTDGLSAAIRKFVSANDGIPLTEPVGGDPSSGGYVKLSQIDTTQPMSLRIQETGTVRRFKIWQGAEPTAWTITDNTAPVHAGPRYVDLYTFTWVNGNPNYYVDNIRVNNAITVALPYSELFGEANGTPWPNWKIPAPFDTVSDPADVFDGRGRIQLNNNGGTSSRFSGYLATEDAGIYDLQFDFDLSEIVPMLTGDLPYIYLDVQLEDNAAGVNYYEVYLDPNGLSATTYQIDEQTTGLFTTTVGSVPLPSIDTSQPMSLRVQESPNSRLFKVWQGAEPAEWTVSDTSTHVHAGPRYVYLYVFARYHGSPDLYVDNLSIMGGATGGGGGGGTDWFWEDVGSTAHFNFRYDSSLGSQTAIAANQEMAVIEDDLRYHFRWFGNSAPWTNGVAKIDIKYVNNAHSQYPLPTALAYYMPDEQAIYVNWSETPNDELTPLPRERSVLVHEIAHHFQALQNGTYSRGHSLTEAHAAFLERQFRYDVDYEQLRTGGYAQYVETWLNTPDRPDFVNTVDNDTDNFDIAVGCELLFLNWLHYEKGYSASAITQASTGLVSLRSIYVRVSGDFFFDPFPKFLADLDAMFPRDGHTDMSVFPDIANPFPLFLHNNVTNSKSGPAGFVSQADLAKMFQFRSQ